MKNPAKKRVISFLLALALIFGMLPNYAPALAAETEDGFVYQINGNQVTVTGYTGSAVNLEIPQKIEGFPVTEIGQNAFQNCDTIERVTIPQGVTSLESGAFSNCDNLKYASIPASTTYMHFENSIFSGSDSLSFIDVDEENPCYASDTYGVLHNKDYTSLIFAPRGINGSYPVGDGVTCIKEYAFDSCNQLTAVTIPSGVITLENGAFNWCRSLSKVTFAEGIQNIGSNCFTLSALLEVTIPESVTNIGDGAFGHCYQLREIRMKGDAPSIGNGAFLLVEATVYYPADNATWTAEIMQDYNGTITWVAEGEEGPSTEPDPGTEPEPEPEPEPDPEPDVEDYELVYEIRDGHVVITGYTGNVTNLVIPSTIEGYPVTEIGDVAFTNGYGMRSVCFPESLTRIGRDAFYAQNLLESVTIPKSVTEIGERAFTSCEALQGIYVETGNPAYCSDSEGVLYNKAKTSLLAAPGKLAGEYVIPESVSYIGSLAFSMCKNLTKVVIPDGVSSIEMGAFYCCVNLAEITMPKTASFVGQSVFYSCEKLEEVRIPDGVEVIMPYTFTLCLNLESVYLPKSIRTISKDSFDACLTLNTIYYGGTEAEWLEITIEDYYNIEGRNIVYIQEDPEWGNFSYKVVDGKAVITRYDCHYEWVVDLVIPSEINGYPVVEIADGAFGEESAMIDKSITIPASITKIGKRAFYGCDSVLAYHVDKENPNYSNDAQGTLFNKDKTVLLRAVAYGDNCYYVPESVREIEEYAFYDTRWSGVVIPAGVEKIGESAFSGCYNLETVELPEGIVTLPAGIFEGCISLESVAVPKSVTSVGRWAFARCTGLEEVRFEGDAPAFHTQAFSSTETTAYYPAGNATWTDEVRQNYGGTITWVAYAAFTGVTLNGSVQSFVDDTAAVTLELVNGDGEVEKIATVTGNSTTYNFADVAAGTYTLRVSKANHVTRSYEIVVGTADLTQDVTLLPVGDITGDGKVTASDYSRLLAHVKKTSAIADSYLLLSADVTGDGKITATDYSRLLAHVKKVSPLW